MWWSKCFPLTCVEYVLMGGQLFAPHTNAKWILGSGSFKAIFNLWCYRQEVSSALHPTIQYYITILGVINLPGIIIWEWPLDGAYWLPVGPQNSTLNVVEAEDTPTNDVTHPVEELQWINFNIHSANIMLSKLSPGPGSSQYCSMYSYDAQLGKN